MSGRTVTLGQRRSALRAHCAVQRAELARVADDIESRLGSVDRGINVVRHYATQPLLFAGVAAILAFMGPRRMFRWFGRGAVLLTAGRRVVRLLR